MRKLILSMLIVSITILSIVLILSITKNAQQPESKDERIKAFCIDFNWGPGGPNRFAKPGLWADANPEEHVKWYKDLGANTIQTFAVSTNGYAWYKNGIIPEQPGLKHDFLTEMVELGHKEGMRVMGYFCIAANTRWGLENPDLNLGVQHNRHIPLTDEYLMFLSASIKDALEKTNMDGFMVDWVWGPRTLEDKKTVDDKWIACEKQLFEKVMGKPFPGEDNLTPEDHLAYERKTIERCWDVIYKTAKSTKPDCIIWLSCGDPQHPSVKGSKMFKQVDWLMNEHTETELIQGARETCGPNTKIMQCLAGWGGRHPAEEFLQNPENDDIGIYGFARPDASGFPPGLDAAFEDKWHFPNEASINNALGNARNIESIRNAFLDKKQ